MKMSLFVTTVISQGSAVTCLRLIEHGFTSAPTQYRLYGRRVFTGLMTQPTVWKHWRRVVSHPDRPQSNHAHLTVLQY